MMDDKPLIPPETKLPEITFKAVIISILLAVILCASNAYLALKVGVTVAASIPAAVISMGILRFFKNSNVLESNLAQTAASAGEGMASVATFVLPALLILGYWQSFHFLEMAFLILVGGMAGVLFAVPLRQVFLKLPGLSFPEGTAIGTVLRARSSGNTQLKYLAQGGIVGALIGLFQTGFKLLADHLPLWFKTSSNTLFGITLGFDPVLLGAGYIIGIRACLAMFCGTLIAWIIGIPILSHIYALPAEGSAEDLVMSLWSAHLRYMGVGTMLVGGVWTLITLFRPIIKGIHQSMQQMRALKYTNQTMLRTEFDMPMSVVIGGLIFITCLAFVSIFYFLHWSPLPISNTLALIISVICTACFLVFGFISIIIAGYLVGLIGSTNSPVSGLLIINVILLGLILFSLIGLQLDLSQVTYQKATVGIIIFVVSMIGFAFIITSENIQDLKAGHMVGATPWKQQLMMAIGVLVSACVIGPVLQLLLDAYGMGGVMPRADMNPAEMLPAPQAGLIAALLKGIITHQLPWDMLIVGCIVGIGFILFSEFSKRRFGFTFPVLAVGLGIYLPPQFITPTVLGGLIHFLVNRPQNAPTAEHVSDNGSQRCILVACGLVAGAALMGVILAVPFVITSNTDALRLINERFTIFTEFAALIIPLGIGLWLYRIGTKTY